MTPPRTAGRLLTLARVNGDLLRLFVRGEVRPLLLIMGLGGNIEIWRRLEDPLVEHGIETIHDASGMGESPPRRIPLPMPVLARQAAHLLDVLGIPHIDAQGVSSGGGVAQQLALDHPHRVRRLVLASTAVGLGGVPGNPGDDIARHCPAVLLAVFFRRTSHLQYGDSTRPMPTDGALLQDQIDARRARPPSAWDMRARWLLRPDGRAFHGCIGCASRCSSSPGAPVRSCLQ